MGNKQIQGETESPIFADHISALMSEGFDTCTDETTKWHTWGRQERWTSKGCGHPGCQNRRIVNILNKYLIFCSQFFKSLNPVIRIQ